VGSSFDSSRRDSYSVAHARGLVVILITEHAFGRIPDGTTSRSAYQYQRACSMGNQHSAPDKDKDKDREKELKDKGNDIQKEKERGTPQLSSPQHEKQRSRTITSTPLLPTETKINAEPQLTTEAKHVFNRTSNNVAANALPASATPVQKRRTPKTTPVKEMTEDLETLRLKDLPRLSADEIVREVAMMEPTPKFETMRVASQTSIVDEDELKETDKSGS